MEQCWDANPLKRPDTDTLWEKISEIKTYYQNNLNELPQLIAKVDKEKINSMSSKLFTSKIYEFENLPEPKNATEEEQKAFYISRSNDFTISSNDVQNDYEREIMQQQSNIGINDEAQSNPNLHSEEKDKSEILDDEF
ncbi:kinase-like domain-containing protein [Rhizophagus irregularis DAOM 181602=DAOM 197198]|nr:kinase-like domain-containing protein [Rhizophagus irregularis DAOM 181602=DAOM 197198]